MANRCAVCQSRGGKFLYCGRCRSRQYCGTDCQTKDWPTHKAKCNRGNYILKVDLCPRHFTNPRISRTLTCPATASFADLHIALQVAFDWRNCHPYHFLVLDHNKTMGSEHKYVTQPILWKLTNPDTYNGVGFKKYRVADSKRSRLYETLDDELTSGKTIHYVYDFEDGWEHVITCAGRADPTTKFVVLGGEGHGCAENVGGVFRWATLIEAYESDEPSEEQRRLMSWFENEAHNKDPRGLRGVAKYAWDKDRINATLETLDNSYIPVNPTSILLVSLAKEFWSDLMYDSVFAQLRSKSEIREVTVGEFRSKVEIREVTDGVSAMKGIEESQNFDAIIVTNAAIMESEFVAINQKLAEYAKAGGVLIFGFSVPSLTEPSKFEKLMEIYGLDWKFGYCAGETYNINEMDDLNKENSLMPYSLMPYSMNALCLKNVKPDDRVYSGSGRAEDQSPAIYAKYGSSGGRIGWIVDVSGEKETTAVLLAMCGREIS